MRQSSVPHLAAAMRLVSAKPTRAALAWSALASPLTPYPEAASELVQCAANIVLDGAAPAGSLGEACRAFQGDNRLSPIKTKFPDSADPANILAARRLLLNDVLHVLLNFGADWPGQLGVFSFVAAQRYCPQFERAARTLAQVYTTAAPWLREDLGAAEYLGRKYAQATPFLLAMPLEAEWRQPLLSLQIRLNLKRPGALRRIDEQEFPRRLARYG